VAVLVWSDGYNTFFHINLFPDPTGREITITVDKTQDVDFAFFLCQRCDQMENWTAEGFDRFVDELATEIQEYRVQGQNVQPQSEVVAAVRASLEHSPRNRVYPGALRATHVRRVCERVWTADPIF
jgi:hypothetical protein